MLNFDKFEQRYRRSNKENIEFTGSFRRKKAKKKNNGTHGIRRTFYTQDRTKFIQMHILALYDAQICSCVTRLNIAVFYNTYSFFFKSNIYRLYSYYHLQINDCIKQLKKKNQ